MTAKTESKWLPCVARYWLDDWRRGILSGAKMFQAHWQPLPEPPHDR